VVSLFVAAAKFDMRSDIGGPVRRLSIVSVFIVLFGLSLPVSADVPVGEFVFPQDPEVTEFYPTFNAPKPDGRRHKGIDLSAPKLSPVFAVADGVITRMGAGRRSGNIIKIDHGGEVQSWYLHLNNDSPGTDDGHGGRRWAFAPGLEEGSRVLAGQFIGYVGDSGNAEGTSPHTHFELRINGVAVDPYHYLLEGWNAWWDEATTLLHLSDRLMEDGAIDFFIATHK
jgi:murein DD-endopeptidase MepM/ murein hydrolase activator NlpD